jgi:YD repeat-containing protein
MVEVGKNGISTSYRIARLRILLLVTLTILRPLMAHAAVVYVDKDATGANNGSSWANAFTTVQVGVNAAGSGDEVWIAEGVYGENRAPDPRGAVVLPADIKLIGGFSGTELLATEANPTAHLTVIDGTTSRNGARATHLLADGEDAVIDGFTFQQAITAFNNNGGVYNGPYSQTYKNCIFQDNGAESGEGGAIYCGTFGAEFTFQNCVFRRNRAQFGGAVALQRASALFEDCIFEDSDQTDSQGDGGALYIDQSPSVVFKRCIFRNNIAQGQDGVAAFPSCTTVVFENCLFHNNHANKAGSVMSATSGSLSLKNCTLADNTADLGGTISSGGSNTCVITNSIMYGNTSPQVSESNTNAGFSRITYSNIVPSIGGTGNISQDPVFQDVASKVYRLSANSPCVDVGTNIGAPTDDLAGKPRPKGSSPDMGAYEHYGAWVLENANAAFGPRHGHASSVHLGSMWVMAGWSNSSLVPTAFRSADGRTWTSVADCGNTSHPTSAVYDGKLWLLGGWSGAQVLSTSTGGVWLDEGDLGFWGASSVVIGGELLVLGGNSGSLSNAVQHWVPGSGFVLLAAAPWSPRSYHGCVVHNGRIFVFGGVGASGLLNDVWSSLDGINWAQETASAPWSARVTTGVSADGMIWVLGAGGASNDVWTSRDGRIWNLESMHADWPVRGGHTALVFQEKIWVMGGLDGGGSDLADVWSLEIGDALPGFIYTNDSVDRLTEVETDGAALIKYDYDPAGNRLGKEVSALLTVSRGTGMPGSRGIGSGDADAAVVQIALSARAGSEGAHVSDLNFSLSGTGNDASALTRAELWSDENASGSRDAGDALIATASAQLNDGALSFTGIGYSVPGGAVRNVLLTYDFNGSAAAGHTFTAKLADRLAVTARGATSGKTVYVMGAPVAGATLTVSTDTTAPTFVGIESAEAGDGQVTVGWTMATDVVDLDQSSLSYAVWVSETSPAGSGAPNYITPGISALDEYSVNLDPSKLFFTVQGLTNGQTYYFLVRAQDTKGNRSSNTEELPATPLAPLYTLAVNGVNGSVGVSPQGSIYEAGSMVTLSPVADEGYVFSGWTGDVDPTELGTAPLSVLMDQPRSITANFSAGSGSVEVAVTPDDAPWVVTDAASGTHQGVGNTTLTGLPVGSTIITWGNVPGQLAPQPATENSYLAASGVLRFVGAYTVVNTGDNCLACTPDTKTHYNVGETACLGVAGTFPPGTLFQWSKQGVGVLTEGRMSGVNCQTLSIPDLEEEDSGFYICDYEGQKSLHIIEITVGSSEVPLSTWRLLAALTAVIGTLGISVLLSRRKALAGGR